MKRVRRRIGAEEPRDRQRIEPIRSIAEITGDRDRALLLEHAADLLGAERAQQAPHPLGVTAALEPHGSALEQPQIALTEVAQQHLLDRSAEQLPALDRAHATLGIPP